MQTRREFLSASTVTLLLVPFSAACSSGNDAPAASPCDGVETTSTVANNHTHTVCTLETDLTDPPAAGVTYVTSISLDHTHNVTLTQAQLQLIASGQAVTATSSAPDPTHNFTIQKA